LAEHGTHVGELFRLSRHPLVGLQFALQVERKVRSRRV
jgi:hypothetical protein